MKLITLTTMITLSALSLSSLNTYADGKADSVDYFAKDKHSSSSYYGGSTQQTSSYGNTAPSTNTNRVVSKVSTSLGEVFATAQGMTLYTFTKDTDSTSTCYGGCAASWPPFMAQANAETWGAFSVIERNDGSYQWAYKNQPLYTWVGDRSQGDTNGHGINNVWYVAQP